jgi:hypothetical protein
MDGQPSIIDQETTDAIDELDGKRRALEIAMMGIKLSLADHQASIKVSMKNILLSRDLTLSGSPTYRRFVVRTTEKWDVEVMDPWRFWYHFLSLLREETKAMDLQRDLRKLRGVEPTPKKGRKAA